MAQQESKKTVATFSIASFLNDMGSDMIYPIWPIFLSTVLHADMAVIGLIDGLGDAIVSISQAISGYYSDKLKKRKIFVWIGYIAGGVSRLGYAFSSTWKHIIPFRILDRAGKMRGAPRDAIISDVSTDQNRGRNFGILRTFDNLGAVAGILITVFLFKYLGYKNLFLLAAIPSFIGTALIIALVKERKVEDKKVFKGISFKSFDKNFRLLTVLSAIFTLGSFSYSFILIYAKEFGFSVTSIPILYLLFTIVASIFSLPFGKLSDKIGRKKVLMISFILWAMTCLNLIFFHNTIAVITTFILYGMHKGAIETVQKAFVAESAPRELTASSLGAFQMVIGLCALPSSLIAGILWDKAGFMTPLYLSLVLTSIAAGLLLFVKKARAN